MHCATRCCVSDGIVITCQQATAYWFEGLLGYRAVTHEERAAASGTGFTGSGGIVALVTARQRRMSSRQSLLQNDVCSPRLLRLFSGRFGSCTAENTRSPCLLRSQPSCWCCRSAGSVMPPSLLGPLQFFTKFVCLDCMDFALRSCMQIMRRHFSCQQQYWL